MFWRCLNYHGIGPLQPVDGMMRSEQYICVLKRKPVPELTKRYPDGTGTFQQDSAPCHTSKVVKKYMVENGIEVLDWELP